MERRTFLKLAALVPGLALAGCGGSKTLLSPKDPTMLSIWHVYCEQADSPMNRLLTEFNDTVGREKGILLNVTNMTNSAAIGGQLQDATAGKPGALDLPDLFSAHPADASGLGIENLVDWNDWFTALIYLRADQAPLPLVLRNILIKSSTSASQSSMVAGGFAELNKLTEMIKFASIIVAAAPMLIVYPFVQKYFVTGMTIGAVKA